MQLYKNIFWGKFQGKIEKKFKNVNNVWWIKCTLVFKRTLSRHLVNCDEKPTTRGKGYSQRAISQEINWSVLVGANLGNRTFHYLRISYELILQILPSPLYFHIRSLYSHTIVNIIHCVHECYTARVKCLIMYSVNVQIPSCPDVIFILHRVIHSISQLHFRAFAKVCVISPLSRIIHHRFAPRNLTAPCLVGTRQLCSGAFCYSKDITK